MALRLRSSGYRGAIAARADMRAEADSRRADDANRRADDANLRAEAEAARQASESLIRQEAERLDIDARKRSIQDYDLDAPARAAKRSLALGQVADYEADAPVRAARRTGAIKEVDAKVTRDELSNKRLGQELDDFEASAGLRTATRESAVAQARHGKALLDATGDQAIKNAKTAGANEWELEAQRQVKLSQERRRLDEETELQERFAQRKAQHDKLTEQRTGVRKQFMTDAAWAGHVARTGGDKESAIEAMKKSNPYVVDFELDPSNGNLVIHEQHPETGATFDRAIPEVEWMGILSVGMPEVYGEAGRTTRREDRMLKQESDSARIDYWRAPRHANKAATPLEELEDITAMLSKDGLDTEDPGYQQLKARQTELIREVTAQGRQKAGATGAPGAPAVADDGTPEPTDDQKRQLMMVKQESMKITDPKARRNFQIEKAAGILFSDERARAKWIRSQKTTVQ